MRTAEADAVGYWGLMSPLRGLICRGVSRRLTPPATASRRFAAGEVGSRQPNPEVRRANPTKAGSQRERWGRMIILDDHQRCRHYWGWAGGD